MFNCYILSNHNNNNKKFFSDDFKTIREREEEPQIRVKSFAKDKPQTLGGTFKCDFCPKFFTRLSDKLNHEVTKCPSNPKNDQHGKCKPFVCEICWASYSHRASLRKHQKFDCCKIHLCQKCGHKYADISGFKRHIINGNCERNELQKTN